MPWLRVDDTALTHPRVMHLRSLGDDIATGEAVVGFVMLAASWSGQHLTDCFIPEAVGHLASPRHAERLAEAALRVGMLKPVSKTVAKREYGGQPGWLVRIDDGLFHLMSREEVERNREHRKASRRNDSRAAVLERDGDQCRYCAKTVNPKDTKGARGRQFDHPDPAIPDELVVSCKECNGIKGQRTPEEAGLELLEPPAERGDPLHFHPSTRAWLDKHGTTRRPDAQSDTAPSQTARPGSQPEPAPARPAPADTARPRPGSQPDHATSTTDQHHRPTATTDRPPRGVAGQVAPGRAGVGVGSVLPGPSPQRSRDGPPRRRRARRGNQPRAP